MQGITELHVTVEHTTDERNNSFIAACKEAGIKAFVVINGVNEVSRHLMTSSVCKTAKAMELIMEIIELNAKLLGLKVIRKKAEVPAGKDFGFVYSFGSIDPYYEAHAEIKTNNIHSVPFDCNLWSVSARLDKPGEYLLTMRARNRTLPYFRNTCMESVKDFASYLSNPVVQLERCISDDNVKLDADWLVNF